MRCPDVESVNRIVFTCSGEGVNMNEDAEEKERKQKTEEAQNDA